MYIEPAAPTPIPWPELFTSFQTGVVEGSKNGITDIMGMKFPDAGLQYVTLDGHDAVPEARGDEPTIGFLHHGRQHVHGHESCVRQRRRERHRLWPRAAAQIQDCLRRRTRHQPERANGGASVGIE